MGNHLTFQSNPTIHTPLFYPASHIPNLSCPPLRSPPRLKSTLSFPLEALSPGAPSPRTMLSSLPVELSLGAPSPKHHRPRRSGLASGASSQLTTPTPRFVVVPK